MSVNIDLCDVPETMLWTLHNRASEARRSDGIIRDPKCVEIHQAIDYDYEQSFGRAEPSHAVRSVLFDEAIRAFVREHSNAVIVNLGEGLETQRFRVETKSSVDWYCVDVPEAIQVRERFITADATHHHVAKSALDEAWFEHIPEGRPLFVTAQGLLMYFPESKVSELIQKMARRWPGMTLMFDHIPPWLSRKTSSAKGWRLTKNYLAPKMPWGIRPSEVEAFVSRSAGGVSGFESLFRRGQMHYCPRGIQRVMMSTALALPFAKDLVPGISKMKLAPS